MGESFPDLMLGFGFHKGAWLKLPLSTTNVLDEFPPVRRRDGWNLSGYRQRGGCPSTFGIIVYLQRHTYYVVSVRMMSRLYVLIAAVSMAVSILAVPAAGSSDSNPPVAGQPSCVSNETSTTGARAFLTPGAPLREDPAFNVDDPDAEDNPLELIRFPDEAGLWDAVGVVSLRSPDRNDGTRRSQTRSFGSTAVCSTATQMRSNSSTGWVGTATGFRW